MDIQTIIDKSPETLYQEALAYLDQKDYSNYAVHMTMSANCEYEPAMEHLNHDYVITRICYEQDHQLTLPFYMATQDRLYSSNYLGYMFEKGIGVPIDNSRAEHLYANSAELGNTVAMTNLAKLCTDNTNSIELLQKAVEKGNLHAMDLLGDKYYYGNGVSVDYARAKELYEQAMNKGCSSAIMSLGNVYYSGHGVEINYEKAAELYQMAVDSGDVDAAVDLAYMYREGKGVAQNLVKAFDLYTMAVEKDNWRGQNELGWMYLNGLGTNIDYARALELFKKAAEKGTSVAYNNIGLMYHDGKGVTQDYSIAIEYFQKAGEGCADALTSIGYAYQSGTGCTKDEAMAKEFHEKARKLYEIDYENKVDRAKNSLIELYSRSSLIEDVAHVVNFFKDEPEVITKIYGANNIMVKNYQDLQKRYEIVLQKMKVMEDHILAQPDGEIFFQAQKDWTGKIENKKK